jgi:hypothetical protein
VRPSSSPARRMLAGIAASGLLSVGTIGVVWPGGADPHHPLHGPPGAAAWPAAVAAVAPRAQAPDPTTATPLQVRRFVGGLTAAQRLRLERRAPGVVGNLDGVPVRLRDAANRRARRAAEPRGRPLPGRLLGYDPRGDGRLIEVFGDLETARHVAVIVPGSGWTLRNLTGGPGGGGARPQPRDHSGQAEPSVSPPVDQGTGPRHGADPVAAALALRGELRRLDPAAPVAVVLWLGYDPPERIDRQAMRSERAEAGSGALRRFVEALPPGAHVSLLCHSYGAVVCGRAVAAGLHVGDLVALGAPGMDVTSASALRSSAGVWAARVADDPMRWVPYVRVAGFGHGADPTGPRFGARVLRTGTASGHDGYYTPGTELLANLARIVLDHPSEVTLGHAN